MDLRPMQSGITCRLRISRQEVLGYVQRRRHESGQALERTRLAQARPLGAGCLGSKLVESILLRGLQCEDLLGAAEQYRLADTAAERRGHAPLRFLDR